jgi:hypothetical protein
VELLRLTGENGALWLPDPPIQRCLDRVFTVVVSE